MKIKDIDIISLFQPLYSVSERKHIAVEALSRGRINGKELDAPTLFKIPKNYRETLSLNKACIRQALISSKTYFSTDRLSIFLNFDSSLMDSDSDNADELFSIAERAKEINDNIHIVKKQAKNIFKHIFKSESDQWDEIMLFELENVCNNVPIY